MKIRLFRYTPKTVDCCYCTEYAKKPPHCKQRCCPWLAERIEAGVIGYKEAITGCFASDQTLNARLAALVDCFPNSFWINQMHFERMEHLKAVLHYYKKRNTSKWYAVLYLASSNEELYSRMINCFSRKDIDFRKARLKGVSVSDYTLLMAAKTIYTGTEKITFTDLADREIVDDISFRLIVNALLVAKYGLPVLEITSKGGSW